MKKKMITYLFLFASILSFVSILGNPNKPVQASSATSYTYTYDNTGRLVRTQDAYLPGINFDINADDPTDIFIDSRDILYISDAKGKQILRYDIPSGTMLEPITHSILINPQGIFVTEDFELYVAEKGEKAIVVFDVEAVEAPIDYMKIFYRPTDVNYGEQPFVPVKVGVDKSKNMFVLSEGVLNGIIYLGNGGEFNSFYTSNRVNLTWEQMLQNIFFTEAQIEQLFPRSPLLFSNFFVADDGHVYTTTTNDFLHGLKKHNTAGSNLYGNVWADLDLIDVWADKDNLVYTASKDGFITVYTTEGEFIYTFGAANLENDIVGVYDTLASIAVDSNGTIWTVDGNKSRVQSFMQNDYARNTYKALSLFNDGRYEESLVIWEEILRFNQMAVMAHNGIGRCYLYLQRYNEAMVEFEIAGNRGLYSEAFWEVRNQWLQSNLTTIFLFAVLLLVARFIIRFFDKKYHFLTSFKNQIIKIKKIRIVDDVLFAFAFFKHPIDSFYELKTNRRGSAFGAWIIFGVFFIVFMTSVIGKDFIYQFQIIEEIDLNSIVIGFFSIASLFIICNYLVSSIQDGDGSIKDIFKLMMYSLTPYLIGLILVVSLSYVFTYNESFMLSYIEQFSMIWTVILLVLGLQEIHSYDTRDAIKSVIFTLVFMILLAVILLIVIILCEQFISFIDILIKEALNHVFG